MRALLRLTAVSAFALIFPDCTNTAFTFVFNSNEIPTVRRAILDLLQFKKQTNMTRCQTSFNAAWWSV